jgi:hypothetical protein
MSHATAKDIRFYLRRAVRAQRELNAYIDASTLADYVNGNPPQFTVLYEYVTIAVLETSVVSGRSQQDIHAYLLTV